MTPPVVENVAASHPAKWSSAVLDALVDIAGAESDRIADPITVIDPFAGIGRGRLSVALAGNALIVDGVELQPEWCSLGTIQGDALDLPDAWTGIYNAVITSPCLAQHHRLLTDDLRWVPAGDIREGDKLLSFEEHPSGTKVRGIASRRRWQRTEVVRSVPRTVECVRVVLANGDEIITTPEHPWLASRYAYGGIVAEWVSSQNLLGSDGSGVTRGHRRGARQPYYVSHQVEPWVERRSYDAGWLAGMFDGEGSLSLGVHGSPKMQLCQADGPVLDRAETLMAEFGYGPNRIWRTNTPDHHQKMGNLYVTGGFPGLLRALGELRPTRLLSKWEALDITTRTVQAQKVAVVAVEPAGLVDIQEIETTSGTYIGEGYLHHNCYGNRMADHHDAADSCKTCAGAGCPKCKGSGLSWRITYAHALRRHGGEVQPGSSAVLQWGPAYRTFHRRALTEMIRVVTEGGMLAVNMSNHVREGTEQLVVEWWVNEIILAGCQLHEVRRVSTRRQRNGANRDARVDGEVIIVAHTPNPRRLV